MLPKIILLNGPSSSGKSTLAKALQAYIKETRDEEYEISSIDDFLKMTVNDVIYEEDVFEISYPLCNKALEILKAEHGVIIDHVITSERIYRQIIETLNSYSIISIHVTCPLYELKKRERERNNRCIGGAEASYEYLYPKTGYDLIIDTLELSTEECLQKITDLL